MYSNYQERGDDFRREVLDLQGEIRRPVMPAKLTAKPGESPPKERPPTT
jgi:hypothetical protein